MPHSPGSDREDGEERESLEESKYREDDDAEESAPSPSSAQYSRGIGRYKPSAVTNGSADPPKADHPPSSANTSSSSSSSPPSTSLGKSGGLYIPPHKLRQQQSNASLTSSSDAYQRMQWEALRKSINGLINKANTSNLPHLLPEIFNENIIRGRGLLIRAIMQAQIASPSYTPTYAALIAVINTKFPEIGELLLKRLLYTFKRSYKHNNKTVLLSTVKFLAHLFNQHVLHELVILQILTLLLEYPTDDSVEVSVELVTDCGALLSSISPAGIYSIFERLRSILSEGIVGKRVEYVVQYLFLLRTNKFNTAPAVTPELDLVEIDEQITHELNLDEDYNIENELNIYHFEGEEWELNQDEYNKIKKEILGGGGEEEEEEQAEEPTTTNDDKEEEPSTTKPPPTDSAPDEYQLTDMTESDSINLRRTIYLTIMSSLDFEECAHKLMKLPLTNPVYQQELVNMVLECCSVERTYLKFYGLLGERLCRINRVYAELYEEIFAKHYALIHRFETNRIRNIGKFFAHLLSTDALTWHVFTYIRLNEEETTSAGRIFIKILFKELSEILGLQRLKKRLADPVLAESMTGIFPRDQPKHTRFAINFFTSIGLGGLTDELREWLKNAPKLIMMKEMEEKMKEEQKMKSESESDSSSDSDSDSDTDTDSSSDSSDDSDSSSDSDSESDSTGSDSESSSDSDSDRRKRERDKRDQRVKVEKKSLSPSPTRRAKDRSRRERSRDRERSKDRNLRDGDRDRDRDTKRGGSRDRDRDRDRDRERERGRGRGRERENGDMREESKEERKEESLPKVKLEPVDSNEERNGKRKSNENGRRDGRGRETEKRRRDREEKEEVDSYGRSRKPNSPSPSPRRESSRDRESRRNEQSRSRNEDNGRRRDYRRSASPARRSRHDDERQSDKAERRKRRSPSRSGSRDPKRSRQEK